MRNLLPSGGTGARTEAHGCDLPADPYRSPSPPPATPAPPPPDVRARLDRLDAIARDARDAARTADAAAGAAEAARAEAFALYQELYGPPELAPGTDGAMQRNPAAVAFQAARHDAERAAPPEPETAVRTPGLLDKKAAAARLGIGIRSIERLVANGRLHPARLSRRCVRFDPAALDAFARTCAKKAPRRAPSPSRRATRAEATR